eukprot:EG_transcript_7030
MTAIVPDVISLDAKDGTNEPNTDPGGTTNGDPVIRCLPADQLDPASGWTKIPSQTFTCVEFPGYYKEANGVIASFGGMQEIEKSRNTVGRMLPYYFRPQDPLSHPIFGDKTPTRNLLVRVTKRRRPATALAETSPHAPELPLGPSGTNAESAPAMGVFAAQANSSSSSSSSSQTSRWSYDVECLGVAETTVRFHGLADFQFLPPEGYDPKKYQFFAGLGLQLGESKVQPHATEANHDEDDEMETQAAEPLHIPPPVFSRWDLPRLYQFRQNPNSKLVSDSFGRRKMTLKKSRVAVPRKFGSDPTPCGPPEELVRQVGLDPQPEVQKVLSRLRELFDYRPVWSSWMLSLFFLKTERRHLKRLLHVVSYIFFNGAYRGLYIKYGFDPRITPTACRYQVMEVRLTGAMKERLQVGKFAEVSQHHSFYPYRLTEKFRALSEQSPGREARGVEISSPAELPLAPSLLFDLAIPRCSARGPSQSLYLQWADLADETVQRTMEKPELEEHHPIHGWFTKQTLERLRSRVRQLMELWSLELRRGPAPPANATAAPAQPAPILKAAGAGKAKGKRVSIVEPTPELPGQESDNLATARDLHSPPPLSAPTSSTSIPQPPLMKP